MPPDEYHSGVNNSVYTNVLVQNRSDPRPLPKLPPCREPVWRARAKTPLSLSLPLACALLLPWPRTWVNPSPANGWQWPIRSRCPLTQGRTSILSLMGTSLVSVLGAAFGPLQRPPTGPESTLDAPNLIEQPPLFCLPVSSACPSTGEEVKQADVVLLGYPIPFHLSPHIRRKNLEIYEAVTSPKGPAMTWVRRLQDVGWRSSQQP